MGDDGDTTYSDQQLEEDYAEEDYNEYMSQMETQFNPEAHLNNMGDEGTIEFNQPKYDSEEGGGTHMPYHLRCDACRIVGLYMSEKLQAKIDLFPSVKAGKKELTESVVVDLIDDVCNNLKTFEGAGLKIINGVQRIGAPGFETANVPGITQGGMVWPHRFKLFCSSIVEEMEDEWEIYQLYRKKGGKLIYEMCYGSKKKDCLRYPTAVVPIQDDDEYRRIEL